MMVLDTVWQAIVAGAIPASVAWGSLTARQRRAERDLAEQADLHRIHAETLHRVDERTKLMKEQLDRVIEKL